MFQVKFGVAAVAACVGMSCIVVTAMENEGESQRFEHSSTWRSALPRCHQWTYERTCANCLAEIENEIGMNSVVATVIFEDEGREAVTNVDRGGTKTWEYSHHVAVEWEFERGADVNSGEGAASQSPVTQQLQISFKMRNPLFNGQAPTRASIEESDEMQTHRLKHRSSWSEAAPRTHLWTYREACRNCSDEIRSRHGAEWEIVYMEFEDGNRVVKKEKDENGEETWKCTHSVFVEYHVAWRGSEKVLELLTHKKHIHRHLRIVHKMARSSD